LKNSFQNSRQDKPDEERQLVQQENKATDVKIDALVYDLYGLTAEEIGVMEESAPENLS